MIALILLLLLAPVFAQPLPFEVDSNTGAGVLRSLPVAPTKQEWSVGKLQSIHWRFERAPEPEVLFALLDRVGGGAEMAIDLGSPTPASWKPLLAEAEQAWFLRPPGGVALIAVHKSRSGGSLLAISRSPAIPSAGLSQISSTWKPGQLNAFQDWERVRGCADGSPDCELRNPEDPRLHVRMDAKGIVWNYADPDVEMLVPPTDYLKLNELQKRTLVNDYLSYFRHEFSLMVKLFPGTSGGVFQWQIWNWLDSWETGAIRSEEIQAILRQGSIPAQVRVWSQKLKDGRVVSMYSNGHGAYRMELR